MDEKVDWPVASAACHDVDASLVGINAPAEQDFLAVWLFETALVRQTWTGGRVSSDDPHNVTWVDESRVDLLIPPWRSGQPNFDGLGGNCVLFIISDGDMQIGEWQLRRCEAKRAFICERRIGTTLRTSTSTSTSISSSTSSSSSTTTSTSTSSTTTTVRNST